MLHFSLTKKLFIWWLCFVGVLLAVPNAFYSRVELSNDMKAVQAQGVTLDAQQQADADAWPMFLPSSLVNLGLDLRGGAHLLAEVNVEEVYATRMDGYWPVVRDALREKRDTVGAVRRIDGADNELRVRIANPEAMAEAMTEVRALARPVVSLSGAGSTDIEVAADGDQLIVTMSEAETLATDTRTMEQSLEIVRRRVDEAGTREPTIQRQGDRRILIQVPGIGSAEELKELIGKTAKLSFHSVVGRVSDPDTKIRSRQVLYPAVDEPGTYYVLDKTPVITGDHLTDARPQFDQNNQPAVGFTLNPVGGGIFGKYTAENIGNPFAIVLDSEVVTAPTIQSHIPGGSGIITGRFSVEETTRLAIQLRAGALPAKVTYLEERTIGPELGQDSIDAGTLACIVAFIFVLVFMFLSYGLFGLFANIALIINVGLIFGLLSAIGATLTWPGIAGIVLTIGMAVDANVLIFERIREELEAKKGAARAIETGYEKALTAIVDANITTLIAAIILYAMGSGPVKGFAVTLGIGIITSVFTAFFVTRLMVAQWFQWKRPKTFKITLLELVRNGTKIKFLSVRRIAVTCSIIAMIASLGLFATKGLNYGIDFKGGTLIEGRVAGEADLGAMRSILGDMDLGDTQVQGFGSASDVLIRVEDVKGGDEARKNLSGLIGTALQAEFDSFEIRRVESMGAKVSGELVTAGILAVVLAIASVLVYIWLRFEWQFSVGAVAALGHDVILTIGVFSLIGLEFNLSIIAAILTIVGYSLNDTVVVFDRVRENLRRYKKMVLQDLLNQSLNETLSRTLMTSITTLIALLALYFLGGPVLQGFTFAMIWGVIVGTYSSIYIASPILKKLGVKRDWSTPSDETVGTGVQFGTADSP